jgi:hypothetical protein
VVPLVETPRTPTRSVAAPAKDQRSVVMKGVGRQLHPRIPRIGSRFIAGSNPDRHYAGTDSVTGPHPQRAQQAASDVWSQCSARILRRDLGYRIHAPPATRKRADAARPGRATPSISAGPSVGLPARTRLNRASPAVMYLVDKEARTNASYRSPGNASNNETSPPRPSSTSDQVEELAKGSISSYIQTCIP